MDNEYQSPHQPPLTSYHLRTTKEIEQIVVGDVGRAFVVDNTNFNALQGVTCYTIEVWEEAMRLPHWHPNAAELGYVISGSIEIIIWRSPGESAVFSLGPGMCWFIPKAALHSLNNIGSTPAKLLVGFSTEDPSDIDLPVAFNGIPLPIRNTLTSPHSGLRNWQGPIQNPLFGRFTSHPELNLMATGSPYGFDLAKVTPLFSHPEFGSVTWGIKDNWNILDEISILRAILQPHVARDPIWYPDVGTLYVVAQGTGQFNIIVANEKSKPIDVVQFDYVYVPMGVLHTFQNTSNDVFEVVAFFTKADPQPEVSLSVATAFFPNNIRRDALMRYGTQESQGDPLKLIQNTTTSPYLLKV